MGLLHGCQQLRERDELHDIQDMWADRKIRPRRWDISISPLAGHAERTAEGTAQDEPVDPRDAALVQDRKPLPAEWMERVGDLSPSRRLVGTMCSSR